LDAGWLREVYQKRTRRSIEQHIRFANFWYAGNGHFSDLVEYTAEIAKDAGFIVDAKSAWQWLGSGGFVSAESPDGLAGHTLETMKNIQAMLFKEESDWEITRYNVFEVEIDGVTAEKLPIFAGGRVRIGTSLKKGDRELPVVRGFRTMLEILQQETELGPIIQSLRVVSSKQGPIAALGALEALEMMLKDGWVTGSYDANKPLLRSEDIPRTPAIDWNRDESDPKVKVSAVIER
jgi:hypothetical protein